MVMRNTIFNEDCSSTPAGGWVGPVSALHSSMLEGARTPSPKNSFLELYQMSTFAIAKKKDELFDCQSGNVSEKFNRDMIHEFFDGRDYGDYGDIFWAYGSRSEPPSHIRKIYVERLWAVSC
ncbi:hypothetical protein TNCV_3290151 [Trichonephila clavipes]|nr:hypothetical protein TNCV_3290151 [Trichonephila clavipes]